MQTDRALLITQLAGFLFTRIPVGTAKFDQMKIHDLFYSRNIQLACAWGIILYAIASACETNQEPQSAQKYSAYSDSVKQVRLNQIITEKDYTINRLFNEVDSIAKNKDKNATDSLNNNENHITRNNINRQLDSLRSDNRRQLRRAQRAAAESPSYIKDIPCSEETFYKFFHVPAVRRAQCAYDQNNRTIERLRNTQQSLPTPQTTEDNIRQYFDSITNVQIAQRLKQIDLLLSIKDSIISEKQR